MAEPNYGIALGVKPPEQIQYPDLGKTLSTYASLQMSTAHAGLYSLEAAKQAMTIHGLQDYQSRLAAGQPAEKAIDALSFNPDLQEKALAAAKTSREMRGDTAFHASQNTSDIYDPIKQAEVRNKIASTGLLGAETAGKNLENTGKRYGLQAQGAAGLEAGLSTAGPQQMSGVPYQSNPLNPQEAATAAQNAAVLAHVAGGVEQNLVTGVVPQAQANAAWGHALDGWVKNDVIDRQTAEAWRQEGYSPARIAQLKAQGLSPHDYQVDSGQAKLAEGRAGNTVTAEAQAQLLPQEAERQKLAAETQAAGIRQAQGQPQEQERQLTQGRLPADIAKLVAENQLKVSAESGKPTDPVGSAAAANTAMQPDRAAVTLPALAQRALAIKDPDARNKMYNSALAQLHAAKVIDIDKYSDLLNKSSDAELKAMSDAAQAPKAGGPVVPLVTGNTPQAKEETATFGKSLGEVIPRLDNEATGANEVNAKFNQIRNLATGWRMGKWTEVEKDVRDSMKSLANFFGVQTTSWDKPLANQQAWYKTANDFVRIATKETSPRASFQELGFIQKTQVGQDMSEGGMKLVGAQVQGLADFKIAKAIAAHAWKADPANNNSMDGFESDWNRNVTPDGFMYRRMDPSQRFDLMTQLGKTEAGRADLQRFFDEIKYAHIATNPNSGYK